MSDKRKTCTWKHNRYGYWETGCENVFQFVDGGPADNGMKFCCYCGRPLEEVDNDQD